MSASSPDRVRSHQQAFLHPVPGSSDEAPVPRPSFLPQQPEEEQQPESPPKYGTYEEYQLVSSSDDDGYPGESEARSLAAERRLRPGSRHIARCAICNSPSHTVQLQGCPIWRAACRVDVATQTDASSLGSRVASATYHLLAELIRGQLRRHGIRVLYWIFRRSGLQVTVSGATVVSIYQLLSWVYGDQ